jgi:hypothetical protein
MGAGCGVCGKNISQNAAKAIRTTMLPQEPAIEKLHIKESGEINMEEKRVEKLTLENLNMLLSDGEVLRKGMLGQFFMESTLIWKYSESGKAKVGSRKVKWEKMCSYKRRKCIPPGLSSEGRLNSNSNPHSTQHTHSLLSTYPYLYKYYVHMSIRTYGHMSIRTNEHMNIWTYGHIIFTSTYYIHIYGHIVDLLQTRLRAWVVETGADG